MLIASDGFQTGSVSFTVIPNIILSETSGKAGAKFTAYGTGLPSGAMVNLTFLYLPSTHLYRVLDPDPRHSG